MPISAIDGCLENHWSEVLDILGSAVVESGFEPNLVSNADDVGIIQKRIIQNLYENPIVVCDVSGKNPNVMFELGLRLAFDKPTIIVKDDKTSYSFDTAPIEHIEYPRDLRFSKIIEFKERLKEKIIATSARSQTDENYTTFLKHFGDFKVVKIQTKEVSGQEYILEELRNLRTQVSQLLQRNLIEPRNFIPSKFTLDFCLRNADSAEIAKAVENAAKMPGVRRAIKKSVGTHEHIFVHLGNNLSDSEVRSISDELEILMPHGRLLSRRSRASQSSQNKEQ